MAIAEREPITGAWERSPQWGPGAEPVVRGSARSPPEAESLSKWTGPRQGPTGWLRPTSQTQTWGTTWRPLLLPCKINVSQPAGGGATLRPVGCSSSRQRYWLNAPRVCRRTSAEESCQKRRLKVADPIRAYTARCTREINDTLPIHDPMPIFDLWAPDAPRTRFSTYIKPMSAWVGGVMALWLLCVQMSWIRWPRTHIHTHTHTHTHIALTVTLQMNLCHPVTHLSSSVISVIFYPFWCQQMSHLLNIFNH